MTLLAARVKKSYLDGTVPASREVIRIFGMIAGWQLWAFWPCYEPHQRNHFWECFEQRPHAGKP